MVPVADVKIGNFLKLLLEPVCVLGSASPKHVSDTIIAGHIAVGLALGDGVNLCGDDFLILSKSQENRTGIGVLNISKLGAVFLFLSKRVLVLLNAVRLVVLDAGKTNNTLLGVIFAGLLVNIHSCYFVLNQVSFLNKILKRVTALDVNSIVVRIDVFGQIDLGFVAMYEAHLIIAADHTSLFGVDGVVLRADDFLDIFFICSVRRHSCH